MQQQSISKGDALQRIGSAGFIIGAILLIIFNLLLPRADDPSSTQEWVKKWGEQEGLTKLSAFLLAVSIWSLMVGIVGVYRSISTGAGAAFARLGFYGTVVATTTWTINFALLMATAGAGAEWVAAPAAGKAAAYSVAAAVYDATVAVYTMSIITFWLSLVFLGIGMVFSAVYPRWQGWIAIALGIITVGAVGVIQAFAGLSATLGFLFFILVLLTALWSLVVGAWIARKAW